MTGTAGGAEAAGAGSGPGAEPGRAESEALATYRSASRQRRASGVADPRRGRLRWKAPSGSGPRPDARDPQRLGDLWRSLADGRGWTNEMALWSLANRWGDIVGPQVAEHVAVVDFDPEPGDAGKPRATSPRRARQGSLLEPDGGAPTQRPDREGGTLTLRADTASWQQQMIWNLVHLQRRIDAELGVGVVGRIVVLGPPTAPQSYGPRRVRG